MSVEKLTERERSILARGQCGPITGGAALALIDAQAAGIARQEAINAAMSAQIAALKHDQAAEIERLRAEQGNATVDCVTTVHRAEAAEAECERLRADFHNACDVGRRHEQRWLAAERDGMAAEARLADATALLAEVHSDPRQQRKSWWRALDTFLAAAPAQPAAPRCECGAALVNEAFFKCGNRYYAQPAAPTHVTCGDRECTGPHAAPVRTEVYDITTPEGAVDAYNAMGAAPDRTEDEGGIHVPVRIDKAWRTEADQAVLDAMAAVPEETLRRSLSNTVHADEHSRAPARAELARRGVK